MLSIRHETPQFLRCLQNLCIAVLEARIRSLWVRRVLSAFQSIMAELDGQPLHTAGDRIYATLSPNILEASSDKTISSPPPAEIRSTQIEQSSHLVDL